MEGTDEHLRKSVMNHKYIYLPFTNFIKLIYEQLEVKIINIISTITSDTLKAAINHKVKCGCLFYEALLYGDSFTKL